MHLPRERESCLRPGHLVARNVLEGEHTPRLPQRVVWGCSLTERGTGRVGSCCEAWAGATLPKGRCPHLASAPSAQSAQELTDCAWGQLRAVSHVGGILGLPCPV